MGVYNGKFYVNNNELVFELKVNYMINFAILQPLDEMIVEATFAINSDNG